MSSPVAGLPSAPKAVADDVGEAFRWRVRHAVVCLLLVALCFNQAPGLTVRDTKLDLVLDPWGFLARALRMWDPQGFGGLVQNQATGYLFPMGPFFGVGSSLGLSPWVVQRLWWSALLVVAFLGVVRLARALDLGTPAAALLAGVAFALSPRMLSSLGPISVEVLPMALAPWAVLPLVGAGHARSVRRAALLSGVAVLCMGGVNAAATLGGVLPAALFVLLAGPAGARLRLALWWVGALVLATSWWAVPLVLLGRYSAPFLPYTETAGVTTSVTSLVEVLRGTSHWVIYLVTDDGPARPAGWDLLTQGGVVLASLVVVALGLAGLARRDVPYRSWLVGSLLSGLLLVSAGYVGALDGPLSEALRAALDGALAPLRNVHKFDPLLRLSLVLGLCHALSGVRWSRDPALTPALRRLVGAVAAVAVVATASPALAGRVPAGEPWTSVPPAWSGVAAFLEREQPAGRALLLPGAPFAEYTWGEPLDEPLQSLARSPWAVRDVAPLVPTGHVRLLDAVDEQLRSGRPSAGLAPLLARSGITHLVVRNDLAPRTLAARTELVREVLRDSPGLSLVRAFGDSPEVADAPPGRPPLEVYAVEPAAKRVQATPLSEVTVVRGGPESLLPAVEQELIGPSASVLAADLPADLLVGRSLLTDGLRRREVEFGSARHLRSAVLGPSDPLRFDRPARDYVLGTQADETVAELVGAEVVLSSSSLSDPDAGATWSAASSPYAAVDGDPTTSWVSGQQPQGAVGQWLELRLAEPVPVGSVTVTWGTEPAAVVRRVRIDTDDGPVTRLVAGTGREQIALPGATTGRVRMTVEAVEGGADPGRVAVAELVVPGVRTLRSLVLPPLDRALTPPTAVQVTAPRDALDDCVVGDDGADCAWDEAAAGEEDGGLSRRFDVGPAARYASEVTAVPLAGAALDTLIAEQTSPAVRVLATTSNVAHPLAGPSAALDGDRGTGWVASPFDTAPGLVIAWLQPLELTSVRLVVDDGLAATRPLRVTVRTADSSTEAEVEPDGTVRFPPVTTDSLTLDLAADGLASGTTAQGRLEGWGLGVSEVVVPGLEDQLAVVDPEAPVVLPCGSGPSLALTGRLLQTGGTTTAGALRALRPVTLRTCDGESSLRLEGEQRMLALSSPAFRVDGVVLRRLPLTPPPPAPAELAVASWEAERRLVDLPARQEPVLVSVAENANDGWTARAGDRELEPVAVDGWQQGFVLPAGPAEQVQLVYAPGRLYRAALVIGFLAALALLVLATRRERQPLLPPTVPHGRRSWRLLAGLGVGCGMWLLAGPAGLVAWVVGQGLVLVAAGPRPGRPRAVAGVLAPPVVALSATAVVAGTMALRHWGTTSYAAGSSWVTALCLLAVATACAVPPARGAAASSPDARRSDGSPPQAPTRRPS